MRRRFEHVSAPAPEGCFACSVCGGAEGSLPTLCPERQMTAEEADAVYAGKLDFNHSTMTAPQWWVPKEPQ